MSSRTTHQQHEKEETFASSSTSASASATTSSTTAALTQRREQPKQSNNIFVLWMTILIVSICTIALALAAVFSHSLALTADVVQNAVDLSTYGVNLYAEYQAEAERAEGTVSARGKRLELAAACFSVAGLIAVGCWVLWAALDRFHSASLIGHASSSSQHINPYILLGFTCLGFAADMVTATLFCMYTESNMEEETATSIARKKEEEPLLDLEGTEQQQQEEQQEQQQEQQHLKKQKSKNVNMISAGAHVMTDAIRSITIVIGAFLIYLQHQKVINLHVQEEVMDGILSCFVVCCMFVAVLFVLREIYHLLRNQVEETGGSMSKFICRPGDLSKKYDGGGGGGGGCRNEETGENGAAWRQTRNTAVDL